MLNAIQQFRLNITSVKNLDAIYVAFQNQVTPAVDLSEILRAEIVLTVSALDCFIHDLVRLGMLEIFQRAGGESNAFLNFTITLDGLKNINNATTLGDKLYFLDQEIREVNGYKSFQEPDKISQALSLLGIQKIWDKVGVTISTSSKDTRDHLALIVDRRNQIAHESDIDPTLGIGNKFPIDRVLVADTIQFIEAICEAIFTAVSSEL